MQNVGTRYSGNFKKQEETNVRIAVIGAGAMGSLFGAMLSRVADIYLIDKSEKHVQAITEKGLVIEKKDGSSEIFQGLFATTNPESVKAEIDLAIIFTKSCQTKEAVRSAKPLLGKKGLALTLQNGLGNADIIADIVGKDRTVAGVTSHGATLLGPGHIRHAGEGATYLAGSPENLPFLQKIAEVFNAGGIHTTLSENLDSLIWGKLIINVGINALAATLRVPNGVLGITPACEKIMAYAVSEAVRVADALGIKLPYNNHIEQVKTVCANTAGNRASMLQDVLRGARTEVGVINRAIAEKGKMLGIPTPYNIFLSEIIEALEATAEHRIGSF